jgi:peptidoglycan/xylan/chitin deacetylase (PgdA/CDA1 family)
MKIFYKIIFSTIITVGLTACGSTTTEETSTEEAVPSERLASDSTETNITADYPTPLSIIDIEENNQSSQLIDNDDSNITETPIDETINESMNSATIYEDAENQKIDNWSISYNYSQSANILNTYDDELHSRVIYLDAKIINNNKRSYDTFRFNGIESNQSNPFLEWSMKFSQIFTIKINITTTKGERWLNYIPKDSGAGIYTDQITLGIGSDITNDQWHTIRRDLNHDLQRYEADNNFIKINYLNIIGGGYIDNIISYDIASNLKIDTPTVVEKPGVVLTFDDSYIENWNNMQPTFKDKSAVATFFCNRWASHKDWDLPQEDIAILKSLQDYGHEIAYHTSDHLSTRDHKYDNVENKAQAYLDDQITPGVAYMRNEGFEPTSFSYPYMSGQPAHNALIREELPHIRAFFAHVTLIDDPSNISLDEIRLYLEKLKREKDIGVFLSHWIYYPGINDEESAEEVHKYQISKEKLTAIIDMVNELGLEFYTLSEAHNIYMNQ